MSGAEGLTLALIGLLALVLRLVAVDPTTLHVDEALYASWGREVAHGNVLLDDTGYPVDKMPVLFWLIGAVIAVFGDSPLVIRAPNLVFAVATVALTWLLARRISRSPFAGLLAALLFAISPFAILFGATVFVDPLAVAAGVSGVLLAALGMPVLAGLMLALALGGKLFALAYVPLAIGAAWITSARPLAPVLRLLVAFGAASLILILVMALRTITLGEPWFLAVQYEGVGGTGLLAPPEWARRVADWWWSGQYVFHGGLLLIVAAGLVAAGVISLPARSRLTQLMLAFLLGYMALLVVVRSPAYDRYLLYLVPVLCASAAAGLAWMLERRAGSGPWWRGATLGIVLILGLPYAAAAARGDYEIAERAPDSAGRAYQGYRSVCAWLEANAPFPSVVWHHSLSWHLAYCLAESHHFLFWFASPDAISPQGARSFLALTTRDDLGVVDALRGRAWSVDLAAEFYGLDGVANLWVYELGEPRAEP